jgi:hypothetical protein
MHRFRAPDVIRRYGRKPVRRKRPALYGIDYQIVNWGLMRYHFAKLKWYRVKPQTKIVDDTAFIGG